MFACNPARQVCMEHKQTGPKCTWYHTVQIGPWNQLHMKEYVEGEEVGRLPCLFQEEYVEGEEVGRLPCEHRYHVCCIGQWLGQKNWCLVCKASVVPSKGEAKGMLELYSKL